MKPTGYLIAALAAFALCVNAAEFADPAYASPINEADKYLSELAQARVIGGIAAGADVFFVLANARINSTLAALISKKDSAQVVNGCAAS